MYNSCAKRVLQFIVVAKNIQIKQSTFQQQQAMSVFAPHLKFKFTNFYFESVIVVLHEQNVMRGNFWRVKKPLSFLNVSIDDAEMC